MGVAKVLGIALTLYAAHAQQSAPTLAFCRGSCVYQTCPTLSPEAFQFPSPINGAQAWENNNAVFPCE